MNKDSIQISASIDHDYDCTFDITVSTGFIRQSLSFFGYTDAFKEFGWALKGFPMNTTHEVMFQQGTDDGYGPGYLMIKAYCYDHQGHTALHIIIDNKERLPQKCRVEFSILAEAASINKLGLKLFSWEFEQQDTIEWKAQIS
ncbi:hypothetical protein ACW9KT_05345 [Hymenobacter sp. HD11105]